MKLPYKQAGDIDIDISYTGVQLCVSAYRRETGFIPTTLFCSCENYETGKKIINEFPELPRLQVVICPFYSKLMYSVGTAEANYGYGFNPQ